MHESRLQENLPESQVTGSGDLFWCMLSCASQSTCHFEGELDRESSKTTSSHFGNFLELEFDN